MQRNSRLTFMRGAFLSLAGPELRHASHFAVALVYVALQPIFITALTSDIYKARGSVTLASAGRLLACSRPGKAALCDLRSDILYRSTNPPPFIRLLNLARLSHVARLVPGRDLLRQG